HIPDRVGVGNPFETAITLHNVSARAARALVVRHSWPTSRTLVAAHATFVDRIDAHCGLVIATTRTPAARGVLSADEVRIDATAPFGLFSRTMVELVDRDYVAPGSLVLLIAGRSGDPALEEAISMAATVGSVALRRGTAVLIAGEGGGCMRARTQASLVELLARAEVREPLDDAALNRAMRCAAAG